jgi:nitrogen PTS system EIIA component
MYLNLIEIAESFGISEKVVEDWIRDEGLPHVSDRGRLLFDRAQVVHWAAAHGLTSRAGFLAPEKDALTMGLTLAPMFRAGGIWRDVSAQNTLEVLERIIRSLGGVAESVKKLMVQRLRAQGGINWAPVGGGFALPHFSARITLGRDSGVVALLLLRDGLPLPEPAMDGLPTRRLFFFISPSPRAHLDILGRLSRAIASGMIGGLIEQGATDAELILALKTSDAGVRTEPEDPSIL